jgi:hypothetical protein
LDESALEAMLQWRFLPAYRSGRRVRVISQIDVVLNPKEQMRRLNEIAESFARRGLSIRVKTANGALIIAKRFVFGPGDGPVPQITISAVPK